MQHTSEGILYRSRAAHPAAVQLWFKGDDPRELQLQKFLHIVIEHVFQLFVGQTADDRLEHFYCRVVEGASSPHMIRSDPISL